MLSQTNCEDLAFPAWTASKIVTFGQNGLGWIDRGGSSLKIFSQLLLPIFSSCLLRGVMLKGS